MPDEELIDLIKTAIGDKTPVVIINNNNYSGMPESTGNNGYGSEPNNAPENNPYTGFSEADYAQAELVGLGVMNFMDWLKDNEPSAHKSVVKVGLSKDSLLLYIADPSILYSLNDREFANRISEQIINKTGMQVLTIFNIKGDMVWRGNCVQSDSPLDDDLFKHLPVASKENGEVTEDNLKDIWLDTLVDRRVNLNSLVNSISPELKEASIPALLAIEIIKLASSDWFKREYFSGSHNEGELMSTGQKLYNDSITAISNLCEE